MNASADNASTPSALNKTYSRQIASNINKLLEKKGMSQNELAQHLCDHGITVNQGNISKYLSGNLAIPLSFVIKLCELFNVSLAELISDKFVPTEPEIITDETELKQPHREDSVLYIPRLGSKFITNPRDKDFSGYLQTYYCYFFPTLSGEDVLLKGILKLGEFRADAHVCEASLSLDTNRKENNKVIYKTYTGCAIISTSVNALYIILSSPDEGEICLINLRHFFIRHRRLNCRMAEVITNSAGETHVPTIHRMLISREEISDEHLEYVKPHLHLNSNDFLISKEELVRFSQESEAHERLINYLIQTKDPTVIYCLREDKVRINATDFLPKETIPLFLSRIRNRAYKTRYNKVSDRADKNIHDLLQSLGYYAEQDT